jgi:hypothetical protein
MFKPLMRPANFGVLIAVFFLSSQPSHADTISTPVATGNVQYGFNDSISGLVPGLTVMETGVLTPVGPGGQGTSSIVKASPYNFVGDTNFEVANVGNFASGSLPVTGPALATTAALGCGGAGCKAVSDTMVSYFMNVKPILKLPGGIIPPLALVRLTGNLKADVSDSYGADTAAFAKISLDSGGIGPFSPDGSSFTLLSVEGNESDSKSIDAEDISLFPDSPMKITLEGNVSLKTTGGDGGLGVGSADVDPFFELAPESQPYFDLVFGSTLDEVQTVDVPEPGYGVLLGFSLLCGLLYFRHLRSGFVSR